MDLATLETRTPDQLEEATFVSDDAIVLVQEPGGPLMRLGAGRLFSRYLGVAVAYERLSALQADLAHGENILALVHSDPEPGVSGYYRKIGAAGAGEWRLSRLFEGAKGDPGSGGNVVATKQQLKALQVNRYDQYAVTAGGDAGVYTAYWPADFSVRQAEAMAEDPLGSMFVDSDASAGITFYVKRDVIRPEHFPQYGDVNDPATAHLAITKANLMSAKLGLECLYRDDLYRTTYPTYWFSGMILTAEGRDSGVINQLTYEQAFSNSVKLIAAIAGGFHPYYVSHVDGGGTGQPGGNGKIHYLWRAGLPMESGQNYFECTNPGYAAEFVPGDVVMVRSVAYSSQTINGPEVGSVHIPDVSKLNLVTGLGDAITGRVPLLFEQEVAITGPSLITKMDSAAKPGTDRQQPQLDFLNNFPLRAIHKAHVGGIAFISEDPRGSPILRCSMLDCDMEFGETRGLTTLGGELICHSRIRAPKCRSTKRIFELAMGCCSSDFWLSGEHVQDAVITPGGRAIKFGESCWHNRLFADNVSFTGSELSPPTVVSMQAGGSNKCFLTNARVIGKWEAMVKIEALDTNDDPLNPHDPAQTQPMTVNNHVHVEIDCGGATFATYLSMVNEHNQADLLQSLRLSKLTGHFRGAAPTLRAGEMNGHGVTIDATMEAGGLRWGPNVQLVDVRLRGGAFFLEYKRSRTIRAELNHVTQGSAPTPIAVNGGGGAISHSPDFNLSSQRITFTNATGFQLATPIAGSEGKSARIEIENSPLSTATITPTLATAFLVNGQALPALAPGRFLVLEFESLPSTAGLRFGLRRPIPGAS